MKGTDDKTRLHTRGNREFRAVEKEGDSWVFKKINGAEQQWVENSYDRKKKAKTKG